MKPHVTAAMRTHLLRATTMRIGLEGYARIIGSLRGKPMSTAQLSELHGLSHLGVLGVMRHCLRAGVVHRLSWFRPMPHSRLVPMWALGDEGDVSMPLYEERTRRPRRAPSTLILLTTAIELMKEGALTRAELAAELCMHLETAERLVTAMRAARLIYVQSYDIGSTGRPAQEFRYGPGRSDAQRPKPKSAERFQANLRGRRQQMQLMHAMAGQGVAA